MRSAIETGSRQSSVMEMTRTEREPSNIITETKSSKLVIAARIIGLGLLSASLFALGIVGLIGSCGMLVEIALPCFIFGTMLAGTTLLVIKTSGFFAKREKNPADVNQAETKKLVGGPFRFRSFYDNKFTPSP